MAENMGQMVREHAKEIAELRAMVTKLSGEVKSLRINYKMPVDKFTKRRMRPTKLPNAIKRMGLKCAIDPKKAEQ